ncbi:MAG: hypothetical protein V7646_6324, partial [Pseudonocardia sp.]
MEGLAAIGGPAESMPPGTDAPAHSVVPLGPGPSGTAAR